MRYLAFTFTLIVFAFLASSSNAQNPFDSSKPGYPKGSPFTGFEWKDDATIRVQVENQWYSLKSVEGVTVDELIAKCKLKGWDHKKRIGEDLIQLLRLMGQDPSNSVKLGLIDQSGTEIASQATVSIRNRMKSMQSARIAASGSRRANRSAGKFDVASIEADLDSLQRQLEAQFAYLESNDFDYVSAISEIRANAKDLGSESKLALAIKTKVISKFIDGHASVSGAGVSGEAYLPFLVEVSGDRYVAILEDRSGFVDAGHPYIERIDGKSIDDWIKIASDYFPKGSPQYVRRHGLRMLRTLPQLRHDIGMPKSNALSVVLAQKDSSKTIKAELKLSEDYPIYGLWPREMNSRKLDGDFGYLRIPSMNDEAVEQIQQWMPKFKDTNGLIVDVRGNGGGIRSPLLELAGYLMRPEDDPRIGNVAKYRLFEEFDDGHLSDARFVYRESSSRFDDRERQAIASFKKNFQPEWEPNAKDFSEWHYMVLAKRKGDGRFYYDKPVIILCDEKCFSATDIFLGALKGWPNVTLMGQPSGGGSARTQRFVLENTKLRIRCASMASFQPNGQLYDTHGVEPDVLVTRSPSYFLIDGEDVILEKAIKSLTAKKH